MNAHETGDAAAFQTHEQKNPLRIQLALQGGGAKIYALIAAMAALEGLRKELQVTRIAGTSAGAIVGCLFAANVEMTKVRDVLLGPEGARLLKSFPKMGDMRMAWLAFHGKAFWNTGVLAELLSGFFDDRKLKTIGDLKDASGIDVRVVSADLSNSQKVVAADDQGIVSALLDSTGLPFCFRPWGGWENKTVVVDGGLCENLPIRELEKRVKEDGPIAAVSFRTKRPQHPGSFRSFALALLDTAISNSMHSARAVLTENAIHDIETEITTLEFEKAINMGLKFDFKSQQAEAKTFFEKFAAAYAPNQGGPDTGKIIGNPWEEVNPVAVEVMTNLGQAYHDQYSQKLFKYKKCVFEITVNTLLDGGPAARFDEMKYSATFHPIDEPISCYSVGVSRPPPGESYLGRTRWQVLDSDRSIIKTNAIPVKNPVKPDNLELVVFFSPVLQCNAGDYTLQFRDQGQNFMRNLMEGKRDEMVYTPRRAAGHVDTMQLIIHVPEKFQGLSMVAQSAGQAWGGRKMTEQELVDFYRPIGFVTYGWVGEQVPAAQEFGVDIYLGPASLV